MQKTLYAKFFKFDEHTPKLIEKTQLFLNSPCHFNDPFETSEGLYNQSELESHFVMACFTRCNPSSNNKEPLLNHLLWSHYADNHQGFCLIFDLNINPEIPLMDVIYTDKRPVFNTADNSQMATKLRDKKILEDTLLTKGKAWEYENESRIIVNTFSDYKYVEYENSNYFYNYETSLQGVVFGCRTTKSNQALMIRLLSNHLKNKKEKIFYSSLKKSQSLYKLEFDFVATLRPLSGETLVPTKRVQQEGYNDYIQFFIDTSERNEIINSSKLCSIYKIPPQVTEGSELHDMLQKWPHASNHDGRNYIFVDIHPNAEDPILLSELKGINGAQLQGDDLIIGIAKILFDEDRDKAIHLTKNKAIELGKNIYWRLWCGKSYFGEVEAYKSAFEKTFPEISLAEDMTFDCLNKEVRIHIKARFS